MNEQENSGFKAVAIVTAVIGGIALAGAGATAAFGAVHTVTRATDQSDRLDVDGVTELDVDVSAGDVSIRFGDVDQAELQVTGSDREWRLERDEDELRLYSPERWWGWGGDWSWFGGWGRDEHVELVLPQDLAGLDADVTLSAGSLDVEGDFGELGADVSAGSLWIDGTADSLDADLSAGDAEINLADVREASFGVAAGDLDAALTGEAPSDVEIDVSAGSLTLTLPDVEYNVTQDVSAGSLDNGLQTSSNARSTVFVELSAGSVELRPAG
ncbi:hypothetical protein [Microbacterium sp.]|uniref:hypothetical protein n=1 Tax=Microbacterium sp. TaxID=51671 RepID=UPI002B86DABF|nr:hypothetical protein [Microbacterium sp.]HWK77686.1 hypothetical protein [Microbacterium sp.]